MKVTRKFFSKFVSNSVIATLLVVALMKSGVAKADFDLEDRDGNSFDISWLSEDQKRTLPATVRSINIISGKPLVSSEDKTGGFGDVAANFSAALNFKKRYPHLTVNLLVTSAKYKESPTVMRSDEIISIMAPELDPKKLNQAQVYHGVNVYFVSTAIEEMKKITPEVLAKLPKTDLTIQFAANTNGIRELGRKLSRVSFDFMEFGTVDHQQAWGQSRDIGIDFEDRVESDGNVKLPHFTFNSGPKFTGMYITKFNSREEQQRANEIQTWLSQDYGLNLSLNEAKLAFGYSKDAPSTALYLEAMKILAEKNPGTKYIAVIKADPQIAETLPPNLQLVKSKVFSHRMMENLIFLSKIPPLVTGDTSVSLAMSSINKGRFFLYDQPPWKRTFVTELITTMRSSQAAQISDADVKRLYKMLRLNPEAIAANPKMAEELARFFGNASLQEKAYLTLSDSLRKLDLNKNVFLIYQMYYFFEKELRAGYTALLKVLSAQLLKSGSWNGLRSALKDIFEDSRKPFKKRALSAMALGKMGYFRNNPEALTALINEFHVRQKEFPDFYRAFLKFSALNEKEFGIHLRTSPLAEDYKTSITRQEWHRPLKLVEQYANEEAGIDPYSKENPKPKRVKKPVVLMCEKLF